MRGDDDRGSTTARFRVRVQQRDDGSLSDEERSWQKPFARNGHIAMAVGGVPSHLSLQQDVTVHRSRWCINGGASFFFLLSSALLSFHLLLNYLSVGGCVQGTGALLTVTAQESVSFASASPLLQPKS